MHLCVTLLSCSSAWVATPYSGFFRTYLTDFYGILSPFTGLSLLKNVSFLKIVLCYNVPRMVLLTNMMRSPWFYDWVNGMAEFSRLKTPGVIRTWWKMELYLCQPKAGWIFWIYLPYFRVRVNSSLHAWTQGSFLPAPRYSWSICEDRQTLWGIHTHSILLHLSYWVKFHRQDLVMPVQWWVSVSWCHFWCSQDRPFRTSNRLL